MNILVSACLLDIPCRYDAKGTASEAVLKLMEKHTLIPVCPEQLGGLPAPRECCERCGNRVLTKSGVDITEPFVKGAQETLRLAALYGCKLAVLKERSPSCGSSIIYDGTFTGKRIDGKGVTAELLEQNGVRVISENRLDELEL
ncbi:DUF523 domain-containing protein [Acetanaerobacterium elongatum]|uniref:Uncharacterized conserved protein YbbK, DUF523 family n=1 Tax=Acetanaerobacterium elongatum TaxID=258515 RepID=A0A1G9UMK7_9FIRM|nr:DUF523 domain-containing protein [Acetanaerobacterium elongatum]SDM61182.1 Uncharacterized conserved protein YbbK, DUF523 family [Acetanaerobacterium elongatum]